MTAMPDALSESRAGFLASLRQAADEACTEAVSHRLAPRNHGVKCAGAEIYLTDQGRNGVRVWIDRIPYSAYPLRRFIRQRLAALGFADVRVEALDS